MIVSGNCFADDRSIIKINFEWYLKNTDQIESVLINGSEFEAVPVVNTLCEIWKYRDGAIGSEVAPGIALAFIHRPHLTFAWFKREPVQFDAWIERLPYALLTDYTGNRSQELSDLKMELLEALEKYLEEKNDDTPKARELIAKLEATEISSIK